ncbi:MAG: Regulatory protein AtoC [Fimbriimonadaceae bacterium]|nr:Regulatory protein AtoC [Fimbriimonadaceae bacterium]
MSRAKRILVVDDEPNIRRILQATFEKAGWEVDLADTGESALRKMAVRPDVVLTDVTMPGMSGYELQREIRSIEPELPVIVMTAFGTIPQAIQAIRDGAFEFVTKPFDLAVLKKMADRAIEGETAPVGKKKTAKAAQKSRSFIAESPAMKSIYDMIERVADSRATVLITGESGTGKEVVARLIHDLSPRAEQAFVAVSCAALPESLLESELFGYEKGAFTGASGDKPGRFELADTGTLFLDEIGEIPLSIQVKLLRVLQEREFERLGATAPTRVDVRLVTATNRNLVHAVDEGVFRLDLLYRLQVMEIHLPPLRDRHEDIVPIAKLFLERYSGENGRQLTEIGSKAQAMLEAYAWPGNVRELENMMERAVVLAGKDEVELLETHLPISLRKAA